MSDDSLNSGVASPNASFNVFPFGFDIVSEGETSPIVVQAIKRNTTAQKSASILFSPRRSERLAKKRALFSTISPPKISMIDPPVSTDQSTQSTPHTTPLVPALSSAAASSQQTQTMSKKIKISEFSEGNPSLWFMTAETIFAANEVVTEKDRFAFLLQSLNMEQAEKIKLIIEASQAANEAQRENAPYSAAKRVLLIQFGDSEETRLRKLFENTQITADRTPSEILSVMRRHGSASIAESAIKELWFSRLPDDIKPFLAGCKTLTLDQLSEQADTVYRLVHKKTSQPPIQVSAIEANRESALIISALSSIQQELAALRADRSRRRDRSSERSSRRRSRRRSSDSRENSQDRSPTPHYRRHRSSSRHQHSRKQPAQLYDGLCWYHYTFADDAQKCRPHCKYTEKSVNKGN
jgi:hypothetical protein